MQHFYASPEQFSGTTVLLTGSEYLHAACSCRVKQGEHISITDGRGKRFIARIESVDSRSITAHIEEDVSGAGEPSCEITVALSVIKPDRFETALEKCTELGARRFIPLVTKRCEHGAVRRLKPEEGTARENRPRSRKAVWTVVGSGCLPAHGFR